MTRTIASNYAGLKVFLEYVTQCLDILTAYQSQRFKDMDSYQGAIEIIKDLKLYTKRTNNVARISDEKDYGLTMPKRDKQVPKHKTFERKIYENSIDFKL